jgi:hypothetical protein
MAANASKSAKSPIAAASPVSRNFTASYKVAREAAGGQVSRAVRALQFETELRTDPRRRADHFVERWQKLDQASRRQYQAGDMSG